MGCPRGTWVQSLYGDKRTSVVEPQCFSSRPSRERIVTGILQPNVDRPGAALDTLKKLRILIRHAINIGWLKHDPSLGIKRPKIKRIRSWTDDENEQLENRWPLGTKQRMAFHLFLNLGQRRSDVVRMAQAHITPERKIRIKQQKTGRELLIPLHRDTVEALDAYDMQHVVIITTAYGKSFTVDGFSGWMRDAITEAGLPLDCNRMVFAKPPDVCSPKPAQRRR